MDTPPPSPFNKGELDLPKIESLGGWLPKILSEKDDNPEKRREVALFVLLYSSTAFNFSVCVCEGGRGERGRGGEGEE